jgi:uncharacterized protein YllA (UPF0747 family)
MGGDKMNFDPMAGINQHVRQQNKFVQEIADNIVENKRRAEQIQIEQRDYLKSISEDIKGINEIVELVRKNNEIHENTFQLFQEIMTVMKAQTPEEADGIIRNVMNKANQANEDFGTIQALIGYGKMLGKLIFPDVDIFN